MPKITLPDGSQREFKAAVSVQQIAEDIGAGLAKAALAGKINGNLVDTSHVIEADTELAIVTDRDAEGLEIIRHSTAHLLAHAVKSLFPEAQVTIGPVIENGFYYDFAFARSFTPEDMQKIEDKMYALAKEDISVERQVMARDAAIEYFEGIGEKYKAEIIRDIPQDEILSLYKQGDFIDLCRGPHVPSTGKLKAFKLTKLAGAYWRGDSNNEMLQRIYGTAWSDKKALKQYLHRLEEAEKRDHRKIGRQLDLFHHQDEAPGMTFWHDNGWKLYQAVITYLRNKLWLNGYDEVNTPMMADRSLWERSGHWEKFGKEMFVTQSEHRDYAIKPMNCPCHIEIFNQGLKSYRDLPLRISEFGSCHRDEPSGTLHGLMRVRQFVQDDAHIFCTPEQVQPEVARFMKLLLEVYREFGFENLIIKLSTRPDVRIGEDAFWDRAEKDLQVALDEAGVAWEFSPGEGAFYGPKIEFALKDCLDRIWQCGTLQLDYFLPERLGAYYIAEDGSKQTPAMLHRAIFGSVERFIGVLIEHYAGKFPLWLAPVQLVVMNIADRHADYATNVVENMQKRGFRAKLDLRNEKIGFKIREQTLQRVPYQLIIGDKELAEQVVSVRKLNGEDLGSLSLETLCEQLKAEIASKV